ncbi:hypothetical protein JZ751_021050 [Albula glossodonta]|uniref:Uncharacterized protein n=1 Tax=Albula glossodonta TaxID=121402 RepID=A0A8T2PL06_9TELE|nr:hypothetical protein JZ751_021050 [Albula glossodonta]
MWAWALLRETGAEQRLRSRRPRCADASAVVAYASLPSSLDQRVLSEPRQVLLFLPASSATTATD